MIYLYDVRKKVVVSVINDLSSDQRVNRTCETLHYMGFDVLLIGRIQQTSMPLIDRPYKMKRMKLFFERGAFFYAEYNLRLFLFLLFKKHDIFHSNDLDTLLANFLIKKIKGGELVYDSHEYFTEVPELQNNIFAKKVWLKIERLIFPKLQNIFTVNHSISEIYNRLYNKEVKVMRNLPFSGKFTLNSDTKSKKDLGIPLNKKIILLQGAGINMDRGAEEMLEAMQWIDAVFLIIGSGDVVKSLKDRSEFLGLNSKIIFTGRVPFEELISYTKIADIGVTLDKDTNLNYKYSLPNKLFDYFQADLPVIASDLIEVRRIIDQFNVGLILSSYDPKKMALEINNFLNNNSLFRLTQKNVGTAKKELVWENEKQVLIDCYKTFD